MNPKAVLFDLDGTLVDSIPDITIGVNGMQAEFGREALEKSEVVLYVGKGTLTLVKRVLSRQLVPQEYSEAELKPALDSYLKHYSAVSGTHTTLHAHALETLETLRTHYKVGVVTNKPRSITEPLLERLGIMQHLEVLVCGDDYAQRKPDPTPLFKACETLGVAPEDTVYVGDSENDVIAAHAANMPVLILPHGYTEGKDYTQMGATALVPHLAGVIRWVEHARSCELCLPPETETVIWQNPLMRVILAHDAPDYPNFTRVVVQNHVTEMSELDAQSQQDIFKALLIIEEAQRDILKADKVNLASLGNMTPHVHWHIIPRYHVDPHFPNPVWAEAKRGLNADYMAEQRALQVRYFEKVRKHLQEAFSSSSDHRVRPIPGV